MKPELFPRTLQHAHKYLDSLPNWMTTGEDVRKSCPEIREGAGCGRACVGHALGLVPARASR